MTAPRARPDADGLDLPYLPYFTHEILVNDWPPGWLPEEDDGKSSLQASAIASANREARLRAGDTGTIVGLSDKSDRRLRDVTHIPGWIRP